MKCILLAIFCLINFPEIMSAQTSQPEEVNNTFRRSSLCLLLVTSQGDEFAKAIEEQFMALPMPVRYNELNVDVRVLNIDKKPNEKRIMKALENNEIAKQLVGKWFNRDYQGRMNMKRIHDWGGYSATFADLKRAESSVRGTSLLTDEGEELLNNTFVMVCDISYYDRRTTGFFLSTLFQSVGAVAGNLTNDMQTRQLANDLGNLGATVSLDMAGFSVNVMSYLYRLNWNKKLRDKMYSQYWVDESTPVAVANQRKMAFDYDRNSFSLEYLGRYRSRAGHTVSASSTPNLEQVIREVCSDAVNNSINNLAKMFPEFKAKTPFYCENDNIYAYIGTKEGVNGKSKFEVLEAEKTKKGLTYNKVATVKPVYGKIWDNKNLLISSDSMEYVYKGTQFQLSGGKKDICDQGLMMREMGKLGYQYKRNRFYLGLVVGQSSVSSSKMHDIVHEHLMSSHSASDIECDVTTYGYECGWIINYHTNFAWNVFTLGMIVGENGKKRSEDMQSVTELFAGTGAIFRTNPLGKRGKFALYVWPTIGIAYNELNIGYTDSYSVKRYKNGQYITTHYSDKKEVQWQGTELGWSVKAGITFGERLSLGAHIGNYHTTFNLGLYF